MGTELLLGFGAVAWTVEVTGVVAVTVVAGISEGTIVDGVVTTPFGELGAVDEGVEWVDFCGGGPLIELEDGSLLW
jgi:hypothetical protein